LIFIKIMQILFFFSPRIFIPIDNLYTSSEKFLLVFSINVWIVIAVMLSLPLIAGTLKYLSKTKLCQNVTQKLDFKATFGSRASKLLRLCDFRLDFILITFWYLIIRTAYQGKLIELVSSSIRKPESRTYNDLNNSDTQLYFTSSNKSWALKSIE
jgi:hypothetical protein